ncbi:hypothetical protein SDC9_91693 [bioreactor metagenome]|uniref:Reverse transcriptase domain-containing protein n=1 Tax=bioreactor metagenome TaxID=1076179 RepID=A0A644ZX61_9ZZZZ
MLKKYSDIVNEITQAELYEGLLAFGLFSDKLPPIFTSQDFFQYCLTKRSNFEKRPHCYIYYENMRNINVPRPLAIPNPMAYQLLCNCLKDNWPQLQLHFSNYTSNQSYKVSRIHIRKMQLTASLFQMNYDNWKTDGSPAIDLSFGKKYLVKADISSCFPSTYTHALPWALVTKAVAKADRNQDIWYNEIDACARRVKHNETQGLLIGPHTSNLLSEIILVCIDNELKEWDYTRSIDDYSCYVETYEEGQKFLTELGSSLRAYNLTLNHKKTDILELPLADTEHWLRKLNAFVLSKGNDIIDYKFVQAYLDHAIELMHDNKNNASILHYAIKVISGKELTYNAKEYFTKTVLNLSMLYPYLVTILDQFVFSKFCVVCQDHKCISDYANIIYKRGFESRNFEQVVYAIYFAIKYGFDIHSFDIKEILNSKDCITMLLGCKYCEKINDKPSKNVLKEYVKTMITDEESFDQNWLFGYEILPYNDLFGEWKAVKRNGVKFVKPLSSW